MESDDARSPTDTEMGSDSESIPGSDDNSCHDTRRAPTQMEIERGLLARYPPEPDDAELPPLTTRFPMKVFETGKRA
ncbi:hypothetical protein N7470_006165 [Penicillium chermesinum]|nr:hypothetical protein N7470_006165 [Penicillium chermesinum]